MVNEEQKNEYTCIEPECGQPFEMTRSEERFFTDKGLFIPKRCPDCRRKRREAKEAQMRS